VETSSKGMFLGQDSTIALQVERVSSLGIRLIPTCVPSGIIGEMMKEGKKI
jgi:hypothetical protein